MSTVCAMKLKGVRLVRQDDIRYWATADDPSVAQLMGLDNRHIFGLAMALNFAAMGAGDMIWPTVATVTRFVIAAGGGLLALDLLGWTAPGLYACVAAGMLAYSILLAFSTTRRAWHV